MQINIGLGKQKNGQSIVVLQSPLQMTLDARELLRMIKQHDRQLWDEVAREIILPADVPRFELPDET